MVYSYKTEGTYPKAGNVPFSWFIFSFTLREFT